ncbi:DUF397 domain-containing protein [Nocardiopsis aegyptia]|uniref:DUF397 domain-containing protein n=1 Tax=Nocardiopsis aegyptia TaxID=220378 RepID=UPI00366E73B6
MRGLGHHQGQWRKSSYSDDDAGKQCVEVALRNRVRVAIRDSQDRTGPRLSLPPATWSGFILAVVTSQGLPAGPSTSSRTDRRVQSSPK